MEKERQDFIMRSMAKYSKLKYIGKVSLEHFNFPEDFPKPAETDGVEVHLFEFKNGTQLFMRWRFTEK